MCKASRPRRVIVVSCSRAKSPNAGTMPALARYNGPMFQMLRKQLPKYPDVLLLIVSAKYGLITGETLIEDYDVRLSPVSPPPIEVSQSPWEWRKARKEFGLPEIDGVFLPFGMFLASADYRHLAQSRLGDAIPPAHSPLYTETIAGPQGKRVAAAKRWLEEGAE